MLLPHAWESTPPTTRLEQSSHAPCIKKRFRWPIRPCLY